MRWILILLASLAASATEPVLLATMGSKASVSFGGKPITLAVGEARQGVKLISVGADSAVFEADGKRSTVRLGQGFFAGGGETDPGSSGNSATLFDAGGGHFLALVSAGGGGVRGMIDTGASFLSLSAPHANTLGIKPDRSKPVSLSTAQGVKTAWLTKINTVKIAGITLYNIDVVVSDGNFPAMPLIGMSVLNQLQMQRDGNQMTLKKKY